MSQPPQPPYSGQSYNGQPTSGQPYQAQPPYQAYPGQPNPDVPTSVPPGYPPTQSYPSQQPAYGQPQYGQQPEFGQQQPDYAQQGFGQPAFPPAQPPKKKSKVLPIVLISIAIVLVLCVGGVTAIVLLGKDKVKDVQDAVKNAASAAATKAPTTPATKAVSNIKIVEPKTLGGRPKLTDPQFADVAKQLQSSLKDVPGATNSVGALYGTVAKQDIVIVAAAEAPIANPAEELSQTFYGAGVGGLAVKDITSAPTGTLGGSAKCGSAEAQDVKMAICSWADDGSLGMMIWYFKSVSKAKAEFPKLRAQIEHQG